jgi:hypothetical protein
VSRAAKEDRSPSLPFRAEERARSARHTLFAGGLITIEAIGRQLFDVFMQIDGVPEAMALAEITAMPPAAIVTGRPSRLALVDDRVSVGEGSVVVGVPGRSAYPRSRLTVVG